MDSKITHLKGDILSVKIPITLTRHRGRTRLLLPDNALVCPVNLPKPNDALIKALARAYLWRCELDEGKFASVAELAEHKSLSESYVLRLLPLNLLAPDLKQAILDGTQPAHLELQDFLRPFPSLWEAQRTHFGFTK